MALSTITLLDSGGVTRTFVVYLNADGNYSMVGAVTTTPPTELGGITVVIGTTATLLSALLTTAGSSLNANATHAVLSNLNATANIYYTLHAGGTPVIGASVNGLPLTSLDVAEVQNLADLKLISDTAATRLYVGQRRY